MQLGRFELDKVYNKDCYKAIKDIPDKSIDCIYVDIPYLFQYVGIAGDEPKRLDGIFEIEKDENKKFVLDERGCAKIGKQISNHNKRYPLTEWRMTEKDCLEYCRKQDFEWLEDGVDLYNILDRVSCWCCANKNLKELRNYYLYLPKYWQKLKDLQSQTDRPFKNNKYTIFDLEEKFKKEQKELWKKKDMNYKKFLKMVFFIGI